MKTKHVLVAPLDWGLGHATRCIPIIKNLLQRGCVVYIGTDGNALSVLKIEFPELQYLQLPAYQARYSRRLPFMINIFLQIPKFLLAIVREKHVLKSFQKKHSLDLIISDNRYGCRLKDVPSVFIGHQINIIMPPSLLFIEPVINFFNRKLIKAFDACWIPDDSNNTLSGTLSKPANSHTKHIGCLSRFTYDAEGKEDGPVSFILSGPEPQRTIFEKIILKQLQDLQIKSIIVRGLPNEMKSLAAPDHVKVYNYLNSAELQQIIQNAKLIVSRSGYSSVMDMVALRKKVIFVPTPGQTEQEYLAEMLAEKKIAYFQHQKHFDLKSALIEADSYSGFDKYSGQTQLLDNAIEEILL